METTSTSESSPTEREAFWLRHYQLQQASGLARAEYCRQNSLSYDNFGYWVKKWSGFSPRNGAELVAIKVKPIAEFSAKTLCTLNLNDGRYLQVHDLTALAFIIDKMR